MSTFQYKKSFARAYGISFWEASRIFKKYDIADFITTYERAMNHDGGDPVRFIRNYILLKGGELPDVKTRPWN